MVKKPSEKNVRKLIATLSSLPEWKNVFLALPLRHGPELKKLDHYTIPTWSREFWKELRTHKQVIDWLAEAVRTKKIGGKFSFNPRVFRAAFNYHNASMENFVGQEACQRYPGRWACGNEAESQDGADDDVDDDQGGNGSSESVANRDRGGVDF